MGFRCYATGDYTISELTEILDAAGLRTPMTAKRPPAALARSAVHRMLKDDYYIGIVTYDGAKHDGRHEALIDPQTFERVQAVLSGHNISRDRAQKHEHYLKGSIYCGQCGGRLIYAKSRGHGGTYEYFRCFARHNLRSGCDAAHARVDRVEVAVEDEYLNRPWLTPDERAAIRAAVQTYGQAQLKAAKSEADRASKRLMALKAEQKKLLQLAYKDLVDDEVLASEQERIRTERAKVEKWAAASTRSSHEIEDALDEALALLDAPGAAYLRATPTERRMLNQAIFERIYVVDDRVVGVIPTRWVAALEEAAGRTPVASGPSPLRAAIDRHEARKHLGPRKSGGLGLNNDQMVRPRGLEPPRTIQSTRPSTLRVYQFRHRRVGGQYSLGALIGRSRVV